MKLLNLNICIKIDNTDQVIALLEKEDADICTLQEVMNGVDKSCFEMYKSKNKLIKIKNYTFNEFAPPIYCERRFKKWNNNKRFWWQC